MDSVFIKVPVSERRPTSSGHYFTDKGKQRFNHNTGMFSSCKSGVTEYWFQEVHLPTEEELNNRIEEETKYSKNEEWKQAFHLGAFITQRYILNHIKKGGVE